jgi:hypothetical protein
MFVGKLAQAGSAPSVPSAPPRGTGPHETRFSPTKNLAAENNTAFLTHVGIFQEPHFALGSVYRTSDVGFRNRGH